MKIYRFGRVSCFQNAAKPRENVIFEAQTTYFTVFFGLQNRVFCGPGSRKTLYFTYPRPSKLQIFSFLGGVPGDPPKFETPGFLRVIITRFGPGGGIQEGGKLSPSILGY